MPLRLAVVVPVLDEAAAIDATLPPLLQLADELVIADGGSRDGTVERAQALGAKVVIGSAGRGRQLNAGAAQTVADILLFVHADSRLPSGAGEAVRAAIAGGAIGGGFCLRFVPPSPLYDFGARVVCLRSRLFRLPLGDQAQFVRRDQFEALGGFRDWPILEDLDFIRRLKRRGRLAILPGPVLTSARRFERRGPLRTVATNWLIWALFLLGASPEKLARLYRHVR